MRPLARLSLAAPVLCTFSCRIFARTVPSGGGSWESDIWFTTTKHFPAMHVPWTVRVHGYTDRYVPGILPLRAAKRDIGRGNLSQGNRTATDAHRCPFAAPSLPPSFSFLFVLRFEKGEPGGTLSHLPRHGRLCTRRPRMAPRPWVWERRIAWSKTGYTCFIPSGYGGVW